MEGRIHGGQPCGRHHVEALRAEALAVQKELRIAATAGEITDEVQSIQFSAPENAKAQPAA